MRKIFQFLILLSLVMSIMPFAQAQTYDNTIWPMHVSANKKYFEDNSNRPMLLVGDTAWSLIAQLSKTDALQYLNDRQTRGVNMLLVNLIEHRFTSHTPHWRNDEGELPFSDMNDFTTVNEAYFQHVDYILQEALTRNMVVFLAPAYMGSGCASEGFCSYVRANGATKMNLYGQYLGNRYKNYPNIVWVGSGDYFPVTSDVPLINALMDGIRQGGANQLQTSHLSPDSYPSVESWRLHNIDIDNIYSYVNGTLYTKSLESYTNNKNIRPFIFIEGAYENEHSSNEFTWRSQMYPTVIAGGAGFMFGNNPIWYYWMPGQPTYGFGDTTTTGWKDALSKPGSVNLARAGQFFRGLNWQDLKPDTTHVVMTSGYGTNGSSSYVLMGVTDDRTLAVAYYQAYLNPTVNMAQMAGPVTARWFDPSSGIYTTISGSPFANTGTRNFQPPSSTNSGGHPDWVLVLQANGSNPPVDTTAPTISITAPSNGANVSTGSNVAINMTASDNVGVASVKMYVNGSLLCTVTSSPYSCNLNITNTPATYAIYGIAADAAGNTTQTGTISITSSTPSGAAITFVQMSQTAASTSSNSVVTPSFSAAPASGNMIVCAMAYNSTTTISGVADNKGNNYTRIGSPVNGGVSGLSGWGQELWYREGIVGGSGLQVTATFASSFSGYKRIICHEYSGIATSNALDQYNTVTGTTATATSNPLVTTQANELIFAAVANNGGAPVAGSGFTKRSSLDSDGTEDRVVNATGSYTASFTNTGGGFQLMSATFRGAGGSNPPADTTPPTVSVTSPTNGTNVTTNSTVAVNMTASDNVGVTSVAMYVNGSLLCTDTSSPYSCNLSITGTPGTYAIYGIAADAAGNTTQSSTVSITSSAPADTTPPTISITSPANGANVTTNSTVAINMTAADNVGVASVKMYVNGNLHCTVTTSPYTCNLSISGTPGTYTIYGIAADAAGNTTQTNTISITSATPADTTPPTISITAPTNGANVATGSTVAIAMSASDNVGVSSVKMYVNGSLHCTVSATPYSCNLSISSTPGTYTIYGIAADAAGNTTQTTTISITSSTPSGAPIAFVQLSQTSATVNSTTVMTPSFTAAPTTGNMIVCAITYNSGTASVSTVSDNKGNSYTRIGSPVHGGSSSLTNWGQELWYRENITGGSGLQVTATFPASANMYKRIICHEYSGIATSNALDQYNTVTGTSTTATSNTLVTSQANELIFAAVANYGGVPAAGSGFTKRSSLDSDGTEDCVVGAAGSYTASFTNTSGGFQLMTATFRGQ